MEIIAWVLSAVYNRNKVLLMQVAGSIMIDAGGKDGVAGCKP